MVLNNTIIKKLKKEAHNLNPVVLIGKQGLTDSVLNEIDVALQAHELIKIRLPKITKQDQQSSIKHIANTLDAEHIQTVGHVVVLFRKKNKESSNN